MQHAGPERVSLSWGGSQDHRQASRQPSVGSAQARSFDSLQVENSDTEAEDLEPLIAAVERAGEAARLSQERTARRLQELASRREVDLREVLTSSDSRQDGPPSTSQPGGLPFPRETGQLDQRHSGDAAELTTQPCSTAACADAELTAARDAETQQMLDLNVKKNALEMRLQQLTRSLSLANDGRPSAKKVRRQTLDRVWEWLNASLFQDPPEPALSLGHSLSDSLGPELQLAGPEQDGSLADGASPGVLAAEPEGMPADASTAAEHEAQPSRKLKRKSVGPSTEELLHRQAEAALQAAAMHLAQHQPGLVGLD